MRKLYYNVIFLLLALFLSAVYYSACAAEDTLRFYDPYKSLASLPGGYKDYIARFDVPQWGYLKKLRIWLGGTATSGSVTVKIFGHEGGAQVPGLEEDLVTPIIVNKTKSGNEVVEVALPKNIWLDNNQFFVVVSSVGSGINILADSRSPSPSCISPLGGDMYYAFLKNTANQLSIAPRRALAIDAIFDYDPLPATPWVTDVTAAAGITMNSNFQQSMAVGDLNGDDYLDFVSAGRVFFNNKNGTFTNKTSAIGTLDTNVVINPLIDMNNDGLLDILILYKDSTNQLFINKGNGTFDKKVMSVQIPAKGTSAFSIADINNDGYPDLFIGRMWTVYPAAGPDITPSHLYINNKNNDFTDASNMIYPGNWTFRRSRASGWCDFDNDGDLDLYVANYYLEPDELWQNNGNGTFTNVAQAKGLDIDQNNGSGHGTGTDWGDYDNDGNFDLLVPMLAHPAFRVQYGHQPTKLYRNSGAPNYTFTGKNEEIGIEYEETHDGAAWADIDNDGLLDFFIAVNYDCRYADIYMQNPDHTFTLKTHNFGLNTLATQIGDLITAGDACWFDYNNDGKLDFAASNETFLRLFKNKVPPWTNSYASLDLKSTSANKMAIGARVEVYAGGRKWMQEVTAGRGIKMQKPARLTFGLGGASKIDSVNVRWPGKTTWESFKNIKINSLTYMEEGGNTRLGESVSVNNVENNNGSNLRVYPNPNKGTFNLQVENYDKEILVRMCNTLGQEVYNHTFGTGNVQTINPRLAPGIYLINVQAGTQAYTSRLIIE